MSFEVIQFQAFHYTSKNGQLCQIVSTELSRKHLYEKKIVTGDSDESSKVKDTIEQTQMELIPY